MSLMSTAEFNGSLLHILSIAFGPALLYYNDKEQKINLVVC